jgi:hypothetical protein
MILDNTLKQQLSQYLQLIEKPVIFHINFGEDAKLQELSAFVEEIVAMSDKLSITEKPLALKPSFALDWADFERGRQTFDSLLGLVADPADVSHLNDLEPFDFVGGIRGLKELERRVDSQEMKLAFAMYPTSIEELFAVADANQLMPPKSTWFEPKLRSGLFIHKLS